jgi:hypothetical protein
MRYVEQPRPHGTYENIIDMNLSGTCPVVKGCIRKEKNHGQGRLCSL